MDIWVYGYDFSIGCEVRSIFMTHTHTQAQREREREREIYIYIHIIYTYIYYIYIYKYRTPMAHCTSFIEGIALPPRPLSPAYSM